MADVYKQSFKQNYTNNIELSIFNCGLERCAPGQTWGPGIRDHYLIHLVVSGKGTFEVGGKTFEVVPGDLFFARPSQLIRYSADEQQPWEYSWVGFNGACAHKLAAQLPFTDTAPVHHTQDPEGMRAALTNIYSSRGLEPQDEAAMVGYLYLFISALMKETSVGKPHTASSSSQYVLNAIKYIQFNYSHDITIDDVAKGEIRNKIRDLLGAFMFGGPEESMKKVKVLSGGERTRLAMIKLLLEPVNLLILDEPTNHLDMKTKDILKQALMDFDGTLIVVSHDRDFLDGLVTKVYEFGNQRVKEHLCGIYEFLETKKMENLRELEKKN